MSLFVSNNVSYFKVVTISCFNSVKTHSTQCSMSVCLCVYLSALTCLPPDGLQWPCTERPVGCFTESQAQRREQQHGRDQRWVCGPQWRPPTHDCGRHFWSRGRDHHHRAQMGRHLPHSLPTGKGGSSSSSSKITYLHLWFGWWNVFLSYTTMLHFRETQHLHHWVKVT